MNFVRQNQLLTAQLGLWVGGAVVYAWEAHRMTSSLRRQYAQVKGGSEADVELTNLKLTLPLGPAITCTYQAPTVPAAYLGAITFGVVRYSLPVLVGLIPMTYLHLYHRTETPAEPPVGSN